MRYFLSLLLLMFTFSVVNVGCSDQSEMIEDSVEEVFDHEDDANQEDDEDQGQPGDEPEFPGQFEN